MKKYSASAYLWNAAFSLFIAAVLIFGIVVTYLGIYSTGANASANPLYYAVVVPVAIAMLVFSAFQWRRFAVAYRS